MPTAARRIAYAIMLYAFLLGIAFLVGWHAPARSAEGTAWRPSLAYGDDATTGIQRLTRPEKLGTFPTEAECKAWMESDEGKHELNSVAMSYYRATGESPTAYECVEREPDGQPS